MPWGQARSSCLPASRLDEGLFFLPVFPKRSLLWILPRAHLGLWRTGDVISFRQCSRKGAPANSLGISSKQSAEWGLAKTPPRGGDTVSMENLIMSWASHTLFPRVSFASTSQCPHSPWPHLDSLALPSVYPLSLTFFLPLSLGIVTATESYSFEEPLPPSILLWPWLPIPLFCTCDLQPVGKWFRTLLEESREDSWATWIQTPAQPAPVQGITEPLRALEMESWNLNHPLLHLSHSAGWQS